MTPTGHIPNNASPGSSPGTSPGTSPGPSPGRSTGSRPGRAKRADARQNTEKVLRAAIDCLGTRPEASVNDIATVAGVGRVTLYSHFGSREALVEAALEQAMRDGDAVLDQIDLTDPIEGLRILVAASWHLTAQASGILEAARGILSDERIREIHGDAERRVLDLIERGQRQGAFRVDMPARWLASVMHHLMKGAAADVTAGRLTRTDAPFLITEAVLGAFRPKPSESPETSEPSRP